MSKNRAFGLLELLIAMTILIMLMGVIFFSISQVSKLTIKTKTEIDGYRSVRFGMEIINRKLSQATLNSYWDYYTNDGKRVKDYNVQEPSTYGRYSELHFVSAPLNKLGITSPSKSHGIFFQSPQGYSQNSDLQGVKGLLNISGFFCGEYIIPAPISLFKSEKRFGLLEMLIPTEQSNIYASRFQTDINQGSNYAWFLGWMGDLDTRRYIAPVAENVLTAIFVPHFSISDDVGVLNSENSLTPNLFYDSRQIGPNNSTVKLVRRVGGSWQASWLHQLPPFVDVYLLGVSETSAQALQADPDLISDLFSGIIFEQENTITKNLDLVVNRGRKYNYDLRWFKSTVTLFSSQNEAGF